MGYYLQRALKIRGVSMWGNEHDGSNIEPVAKRLRALKGSLGMVIEQSPLAIHVLTPDGFPLLNNSSWKNLWNPGEDSVSRNVFQDKQLQAAGLISKIEECLLTGETVTSSLLHDPARTGRKDLEERLEHQALHDPLTGLPNRSLFLDRAHGTARRWDLGALRGPRQLQGCKRLTRS